MTEGGGLRITDAGGNVVPLDRVQAPPPGHPNRYRVQLPYALHFASGSYEQGDEFVHEFTADEEWTYLESGLLELLPNRYEVIGACDIMPSLLPAVVKDLPATAPQRERVHPGETFEASVPLAREIQLIHHIRLITEE